MWFVRIGVLLTIFGSDSVNVRAQEPAGSPTQKETPQPTVLDALIQSNELWTAVPADFVKQNGTLGFHWVSKAREAAETTQKQLTLFGVPVCQAVARFDSETLRGLTVSLYNRGDAGDLQKEKFEGLLRKCVDGLSNATKSKPFVRGKDAASAVKAEGVQWQTTSTKFLLEYSFTREVKTRNIPFRAEFVRLEITPVETQQGLLDSNLVIEKPGKFSGPSHVKRDANGDVRIEGIPMVDQGTKGYCVVASVERVMRYYGIPTDEHELAQIANTSSTEGTTYRAMFEALKKLSNRLRIKTRELDGLDIKEIETLVTDYNRAAKRGHRAEQLNLYGEGSGLSDIYQQMEPELLREVRTKNQAHASRFQRQIQTHIDMGIPLLWSVMLGVVKEGKNPQSVGGHTRLIIGYNLKTNEVLYSDSWGLGHELKRMSLADAWTMTTQMHTVEPL